MTPQGWLALGVIVNLLLLALTLFKVFAMASQVAFLAGELRQQVRTQGEEIDRLRKWRESLSNGITAKAHNAHGGL